jgi:hypothetical protein
MSKRQPHKILNRRQALQSLAIAGKLKIPGNL